MAVLTGNVIINVYGFNDGEVQTIQTTEKVNSLSCKFDAKELNQWVIDNIVDYTNFNFRLRLTGINNLNLKHVIGETTFDNSPISQLIFSNLYLSLLNDVKRTDGYSLKTYELYQIDNNGVETLIADLNIDFEFQSIVKGETTGEVLLDTKIPDFIGKANTHAGYDTLLSYDELDKWTKLRLDIEEGNSVIIDRIPMEPIDVVLPLPDYAKGKGYGLKTFIGSNFFSKDKQVEIGLNEDTDDTIYESKPKIYGIEKTSNTIPTVPTPFVPIKSGTTRQWTIPSSEYLEPLTTDIKFIKFSTQGSGGGVLPKTFNFVPYVGKDIDYTVQGTSGHFIRLLISKTQIEVISSVFGIGQSSAVEFWALKDYK